jgi:hypothetical protein
LNVVRGARVDRRVDGWTIFFLVVDAAGVIGCLVLAARTGRTDGGLRRRIWLVEAAAYAGLFGLVWLADPAMTLGVVSLFIPDAAAAGFALWLAMGLGSRPSSGGVGSGRGFAVVGVVLTWGILVFGVALGHEDKQQGITDGDRDTTLLGEQIDDAHNHVPVQLLDRRPTLTDAGIDGASAERIERSILGRTTLTMVVHAAAPCEPAVVLLSDQDDSLDVLHICRSGRRPRTAGGTASMADASMSHAKTSSCMCRARLIPQPIALRLLWWDADSQGARSTASAWR